MALKVFVSDGESYLCRALVKKLRADGHNVVTSVRAAPAGRPPAQDALVDSAAAVHAALDCNVVVLSLLTALSEAETIVEAVRAQAAQFALGNTDDAVSKTDDDEGSAAEPPPGYDKTVIALSSTLTWDRSTSMRPPYQEPNYRRRRPGTKSAEVKLAESHVMALGAPERGLRCHVVAAGLPYGDGQGPLLPLFRRAWLCVDAPDAATPPAPPAESAGAAAVPATSAAAVGLPLPCLRDEEGANLLPTIHVRDLAAFVAALVVGSPAVQQEAGQAEYLVAVDEGRDSLRAVGLAVARALGAGAIRLIPKADVARVFATEDAPLRPAPAASSAVAASVAAAADDSEGVPAAAAAGSGGATPAAGSADAAPPPSARVYFGSDPTMGHAMLALLQAHANFDAGSLSIFSHPQLALPDDQWHARGGLVAHIDAVAAEFRLWHDLRPLRVVVLGAPTVGKSHAAGALAAKYHLPVVDARSALATVRTGGNLASLGDGTPERDAALAALREAVDKALSEAEATAAAIAAAAAAASPAVPVSGKAPAVASATTKTNRAKAGGAAAAAAAAMAAATPEEQAAAAAAADRPPRIPRALLVRALRAVLLSPRCRNAGWVLDGFPRTWADADALFSALPEEDDGVTPAPEDVEAQPREEADETALVAAEAAAVGVSVVVGDVVVVSPTVREESKDDAEGGEGEDDGGGDGAEDDAAALDHSELLAARELHAGLRPTASLLLNAPDAWLEARLGAMPPGAAARNHNSRDALHRRLRFARLHLHTSLTRTPVTWLETHARQEVVSLAVDTLWSRAQARAAAADAAAAAAADPLSPALEDDRIATAALLRYIAAVPSAASTWGLGADAVAAAAGPRPLLIPADLPSATARAFACLGSAELTAAAPANERGGRPHNFHPTPEEVAALDALARARAVRLAAVTRAADLQAATQEESHATAKAAAADAHVAAVEAAEAQLLEARTAPLRAYLLSNVIPHVTAGLADVVKAGPGVDPVDHLAGFLLAVASQLEDSSKQQQLQAAAASTTH